MSHLTPIYAVWDHNAEAMASDIGEPGVKVRQWRNRGNIPPIYWQRIIDAAAKKGWTLKLPQFLPGAADRPDWALSEQELAELPENDRVVLCDVCQRPDSDPATRVCPEMDCPFSDREAA